MKIKHKTLLISLITIALSLTASSLQAAAPTAKPNSKLTKQTIQTKAIPNTSPITITPENKHITISLPENTGSTGYQWYLTSYNRNYLQLTQYTYKKPTNSMPGKAGTAVFEFDLKSEFKNAPQITSILFVKAQPWNLNSKITKKYTVISVGR